MLYSTSSSDLPSHDTTKPIHIRPQDYQNVWFWWPQLPVKLQRRQPRSTDGRIPSCRSHTTLLGRQHFSTLLSCRSRVPISSVRHDARCLHLPAITRDKVEISPSNEKGEEDNNEETEHGKELEWEPLSLQIPEEDLRRALQADPGAATHWSHELYRGPKGETVFIHYCTSKATVERELERFLPEKAIGFDIEWVSNSTERAGLKSNVSLLQFACEHHVVLCHIALHKGDEPESLIGPTLRRILESASILKIGVGIRGDCTRVKKWLGIAVKGQFELSNLHKLVKYYGTEPHLIDRHKVALAKQVQEHFALPLSKSEVRYSDWGSRRLNSEQTKYAAADAYAGFRLFDLLERKRLAMDPTPSRPPFAELGLPITPPKSGAKEKKTSVAAEKDDSTVGTAKTLLSRTPPQASHHSGVDTQNQDMPKGTLDQDVTPQTSAPHTEGKPTFVGRLRAMSRSLLGKDENASLEPNPKQCAKPEDGTAGPAQQNGQDKSTPGPSPQHDLATTNAKKRLPHVKTPEVERAEAWVDEYEARALQEPDRKVKATRSQLRAYALWHHEGLSLHQVAAMLRDPPLKDGTVATYIMEAVRIEQQHLRFNRERLEKVYAAVPLQALGLYGSLMSRLG